jgi:transposase
MTERETLTIEEAARVLGVSRGVAYDSARRYLAGDASELPVVRLGQRRLLVPKVRLERLLGGDVLERNGSGDERPHRRPGR